ncbi:MAG: hypothetical protein D6679_00555 [Candidatus Hydrogenedentota bacterium]|nr:MAG: hypothetical protein D6679_00555 [Candidatus Hydrogenedentota bacterium]
MISSPFLWNRVAHAETNSLLVFGAPRANLHSYRDFGFFWEESLLNEREGDFFEGRREFDFSERIKFVAGWR